MDITLYGGPKEVDINLQSLIAVSKAMKHNLKVTFLFDELNYTYESQLDTLVDLLMEEMNIDMLEALSEVRKGNLIMTHDTKEKYIKSLELSDVVIVSEYDDFTELETSQLIDNKVNTLFFAHTVTTGALEHHYLADWADELQFMKIDDEYDVYVEELT